MRFWATIAVVVSLLPAGIHLAAQDQAPPAAPTSPSDQSAPNAPPQTEPAPAAPPSAAQPSEENQTPTPPMTSPAAARKPTKKKSATKASGAGHKVVVRNGGAKDESVQLAPSMSKEQELHSRETTAQLLATTDANLKIVAGRRLTPAQQNLLDQVHSYIRQSKEASDSGDLTRAHTLAYKAHLLSDELRK